MHQNEDEQSICRSMEENYLPHDLINQIIPRLPVKSRLHFKCVHKSLFSLISDSHLKNSHFQITAAKHTHRIMFMSYSIEKTLSLDFESKLQFESTSQIRSPNFELPRVNFLNKIILFTPFFKISPLESMHRSTQTNTFVA
jgi:hypothetical protein